MPRRKKEPVAYDRESVEVTLKFSDGLHARHFIGWFLDGGGDDMCARSAHHHMGDGVIGLVALEHGGVSWPSSGFPSDDE